MEHLLKNQTALITGANSGIGAAIALAVAVAGGNVAINYVTHPEDAEQLASRIKADGGHAVTIEGDVSNEAEVERMFAETVKEFGRRRLLL